MSSMINILSILQTVALGVTVIAFWLNRRKDRDVQVAWETTLNNTLEALKTTVNRLELIIEAQGREIQTMKLTIELLMQQHRMNHGHDINGGT